jgi:hypothetical protein
MRMPATRNLKGDPLRDLFFTSGDERTCIYWDALNEKLQN